MLDVGDIDGVAVLLPHSLHFRAARDALDAGMHVLVEKPAVRVAEDQSTRITSTSEFVEISSSAFR